MNMNDLDNEALDRYIETTKRLSEKGTFSWWSNLALLLEELKKLREEKEKEKENG